MEVYNKSLVHSSLGMTPQNASKDSNAIDIKTRLELKANTNRRYPEIKVGDKVHIGERRQRGRRRDSPPGGTYIIR